MALDGLGKVPQRLILKPDRDKQGIASDLPGRQHGGCHRVCMSAGVKDEWVYGVREQCEGASLSERGSVHKLLHVTNTRVRSKGADGKL